MKSRIYFTFFLFFVYLFSFSQSDEIVEEETDLDEITINYDKKTSKVSFLGSQNITTLTSDELLKAACCNLAESFETTPSIDVNFSDAISGSKQIKMLGLSSPNILISIENIPTIRGALQSHGLEYIPCFILPIFVSWLTASRPSRASRIRIKTVSKNFSVFVIRL